ncbi:MAG: hypothetical protein AOA65_0469 [Candidatus Bathyarchaeota archaeon BA1]|nr:MAG: hypothetical protein AOA65_0469 [Candidatus Bathyarchaeota archaeon BA1]
MSTILIEIYLNLDFEIVFFWLCLHILLGLCLPYLENRFFLGHVKAIFANSPLAITLVFIHNVIAVSLIIIEMRFYVEFVLTFLPKRDIEYAVLHHPRLFAFIFTALILTVSILRVGTFLHRQIVIDLLSIIMLASLPHGIVECYGIYRSIHKILTNSSTNRA